MSDFESSRARARAHGRRGQFADAAAALREALAERPDDLPARLDLVLVLRRLRRAADAETEARAAVARAPGAVSVHEALGGVLFEQGRDREAAAAFRDVLRLRPDHARAQLNLAWALTVALAPTVVLAGETPPLVDQRFHRSRWASTSSPRAIAPASYTLPSYALTASALIETTW